MFIVIVLIPLNYFFNRRYFATVFAICYAIFLVVFGAAVFVGDAAADMDQYPIPEIFCIFMLSVGFAYFIFLFIDIRLHVRKAKNTLKAKQERMRIYEEQLSKAEVRLKLMLLGNHSYAFHNAPIRQVYKVQWSFPRMLMDISICNYICPIFQPKPSSSPFRIAIVL